MPSIACEVIVPLVSGKTRAPWHVNKVPDWENAVAFLFGGISPVAMNQVGLWRNPAPGAGIVPDPQNRYEIAVDPNRISELRQFVLFSCVHFEQECMYFKVGTSVELLDNPAGWP